MTQSWDLLNSPLFQIQKTPITLITLCGAILFILCAFIASRLVRRVFLKKVFPRLELGQGQQYTILRLTHYGFIFIGILLGLQFIGLDLSNFAVIAGLFSVGIGFGLQSIVSNFIAGMVLLFEQPVKIGDRVTVGDIHGDVHEINIRSTTILTTDNIAMIVPNTDLVNGKVTNWSYEDPRVRLHLTIPVSYQSDIQQVQRLLCKAAETHPRVLKNPLSQVLITRFGESAIQFDLEVWVSHAKGGAEILSELHYAIFHLLKEHGIGMPMPQREVSFKTLPVDTTRL